MISLRYRKDDGFDVWQKRICTFLLLQLAGLFFFMPFAFAAGAYNKSYVGEMGTYITSYEDTMIQIARNHNIGFNELRAANQGIDPWIPGAGVKVVLPTMHILPKAAHEGIVINVPEQRFYYFFEQGAPPITHPIGVGREGLATPEGKTTIVRKAIGPIWRPTPRMREADPKLPAEIGPGPDNPMGTHAMYLGWPEYAMHGTNKPYGIGRRSSSGCIRLYPEDIVSMYEIVPVGTQVTVVNQPVKVGWVGNDLYMEAHPSLDQAADMEQSGVVTSYEFTDKDLARLMEEAGIYADLIDWPLVRKIIHLREGSPVIIARKPLEKKVESEEKALPEDIQSDEGRS
ncbi:MAG: L,D-transpeptidase [Alphaproteobacteria bacterium CG_4_9_14_3_um_filter_47_13]|nr:MAG: L,D-transpeptidase [Alphaproteobacteria bacterium CG_4_9_14_3_um_filter_47_13]